MTLRWPNGVLTAGWLPFSDTYGIELSWGNRSAMGETVRKGESLFVYNKVWHICSARTGKIYMTAGTVRALGLIAAALCFLMALAVASVRADDKPALRGCFVEGSAVGQLLHDDRKALGGLGLGCDVVFVDRIVAGGVLRGDFGEIKSGELAGRVGFLVNPSLLLYGSAAWIAKDYEFADNGTAFLGAGAETELFYKNLSVGVEGSHAVSKFGREALAVDDTRIRVYGRFRLVTP